MKRSIIAKIIGAIIIVLVAIIIIQKWTHNEFSGRTTIRFWNGFTGPDGRTMIQLVKRFNADNPDYHVLMQRMDWSTYYNKLFIAGMGDRAPHVFIIHTDALERFVGADFVRPLDDLTSSVNGVDVNDIDTNVWEATERDGEHYGLPLDIHLLGMFYNRDLFIEAGIVDDQGNPVPPTNQEEFLEAAKKLTKDIDGDGRNDQWGYVFTNFIQNVYTVMNQYGGTFFANDYTESTINNQANIDALQFCVDLINKYKVAPTPEDIDSWIGFLQGKVGMVFAGIFMLSDLSRQQNLDFGAAPIPLLGTQDAVWAGSHNLCLRSNLSDDELEGSWRFIKFLSENSLDWAEGGQVPIRKSLRNTDRFRNMTAQSEFGKQIPYAIYMPPVGFGTEFAREYNFAIERALRGRTTPKDALDMADKNIEKVIKHYLENYKKYR